MHSPGRFRATSRSRHLPRWDGPDGDEEDEGDAFLSASDLVKTLQPVPHRPSQSRGRPMTDREPPRRWPQMETQTPLGFNEWPFDGPPGHEDSRSTMDYRSRTSKTNPAPLRPARAFAGDQLDFDPDVLQEDADDYQSARSRTFQMNYDEPRHSQAQLQRYQQQRQYQRAVQREFSEDVPYRRAATHSEHELHGRDVRGRDALEEMPFDPPRRIQQRTGAASPLAAYGRGANGLMRESHARMTQTRRYNGPSSHSPGFGPRMDELPLESAVLDMYPDEMDTSTAPGDRRREYGQPQLVVGRQRIHQQISRRADRLHDDEMLMAPRRPFNDPDLPRDRRGGESRAVYEELVPTPTSTGLSQNNNYGNLSHDGGADGADVLAELSSSRQRVSQPVGRPQKTKRSRADEDSTLADSVPVRAKGKAGRKSAAASTTSSEDKDAEALPKRRCGRKSMNYSSEQKRERNRAAVKKCRQRQALKLEYLQHKAESLAAENQALSEMLVKNAELDAEQRTSLTRGIQMDILLKIKEIFTQSLPKDFVLDADSIWDLNSVLAVSMPSRCYYGIESIKDFWRTSLRMRNKGKIRSFWAWLFRLPPGDRFSEFEIQPFSATSNLYFISWTTKSTPPLAGSMVIMFGNGHRVTLHVECFGWLIWRYLLTNEPFPEPALD